MKSTIVSTFLASLTVSLTTSMLLGVSAQAAAHDVTSQLSNLKCEIPSDDHNGSATLLINEKHGFRSLILVLQSSRDAHWKMVSYPVSLASVNEADGSLTLNIEYKAGYEGSATILQDKSGQFVMKSNGFTQTTVLSNCSFAL